MRDLLGELELEDDRQRPLDLARASRRAPRPAAIVRGKPSSTKPPAASPAARRSRISSIMRSSGTRSPRVVDRLDPAAELACRRRSPRAACRRSRCAGCRTRRRSASPGFPCRRPAGRGGGCSAPPLLQEAFVGAHHHLRLHLPHRVERDADDDQHRGAAEGARGRLREAAVADEEARQHRDGREVERAGQRQPRAARGRGTARSAGPGRMPGM